MASSPIQTKKNQNRALIGRNCCIKNEVCSLAFADKNLIYPVSKIESNMTVNREMEVVMNKALDIYFNIKLTSNFGCSEWRSTVRAAEIC